LQRAAQQPPWARVGVRLLVGGRGRKGEAPVLTIESGDEIETEDAREAAAWHEIHNAYATRDIDDAVVAYRAQVRDIFA